MSENEKDDADVLERPRSPFPSEAQVKDLLADLDYLWRKLVLRSARPQHAGIYDRLRGHFLKLQDYAERAGADGQLDEDEDEEDEPSLAIARRVMLSLTPEQRKQVDIMLLLHELSEFGRVEVFDEQEASHCMDCGAEAEADDESHLAVCPARKAGEDEGEPDEPETDPQEPT